MKKYIISFAMLLASASVIAQDNQKTVSGRVVDAATGQPLAGVIVSAYDNQSLTTMTDEEGKYELKVTGDTRSVLMRIDGYNLQQRSISGDKADARLYSNAFTETYKRSTSAGIAAEATRFDNSAEVSIDPLIAQQLGGDVRTISRSGIPGLGNMMFIEGINSLNVNAQPLVIVDDVIMDMQYNRSMLHDGYYNNILANLNINDIESVEVLKNGTALYGAKGANGVILIKTKRNKSMATKIDVNINGRYELTPRLPKMMGAEPFRLYTTELLSGNINPQSMGSMRYLNSEPSYFYYKKYHNSTDWTDEVYENAFSQNYGINVQGGDDIASYNLSVGYSLGNSTLKSND
ncbi:MAG: carboxypeptidase regulatory-like domain-containing protein, partial [Prevotella sp.]|nr:carboxypeptidase regulatory-like domain-containing protein [Prevotella sp.]